MKEKLLKTKSIMGMGILAIGMIFGISILNNNLLSQQTSFLKLNNGVGICFQRITQTFTALMIRDLRSDYLTSDFRSTTGDCLNEVKQGLLSLSVSEGALKTINNLQSDFHWFEQKIDKVNTMAMAKEIDITQSNIITKYSELEELKTGLEDQVLAMVSSIESTQSLSFTGIFLGQFALLLAAVAFFFNRKLRRLQFNEVEAMSVAVEKGEIPLEGFISTAVQVFDSIEMPETRLAVEHSFNKLVEENIQAENSLLQMNNVSNERFEIDTIAAEKTKESSDFNLSFNTVLDRMQAQAFKAGILLDTSLNDDFWINSSHEALEQLLYNLMSFAMDCSALVEVDRVVKVRSKSLGGIAYCKVQVKNYSFNEDQLGVLNGKEPSSETSINLILLRELIKDANASIAVKNKQNSLTGTIESEIEIVFDRVQKQKNKNEVNRVNVVKGNKQEIRNYFNARL
ncbi:MAG: hypothetical protein HON90_09405 [Halobacteriovoraceae bacterium]|nr:hypothetical protein [Halobacteriovoraceae bacterium]